MAWYRYRPIRSFQSKLPYYRMYGPTPTVSSPLSGNPQETITRMVIRSIYKHDISIYCVITQTIFRSLCCCPRDREVTSKTRGFEQTAYYTSERLTRMECTWGVNMSERPSEIQRGRKTSYDNTTPRLLSYFKHYVRHWETSSCDIR